jgi:ABC-type antimicrobial peptide transport system permease subunit
MILKSLLGRKVRTLLTILGIAIGVAAVVALGTLAEGLIEAYGATGGSSGADILVMQDDALDIVFSAVDESLESTLIGFSGVTDLSKMVYTFASSDTSPSPYFIVYGYEPKTFAIERFKITAGTSLTNRTAGRGGRPMLLGRTAAEDLNKMVGDTFRLYETTYRIVGIYETGEAFEDGAAVVLLEDAQAISGKPHQVNAFLLKVRDGTDVQRLQSRIESRFEDLTATTSTTFQDEQEMIQYLSVFTWSVSLIALLIGGVGVMNTMLMSVVERTREFGVLRALGWRPWRILRLVLSESLLISALAGVLGIGLGLGVMWGVQKLPLAESFVPQLIFIESILQGFVIALGLGLVGGFLPAIRASRMPPAEAMRAEGGTVHAPGHVRSAALRNVIRQPVRTLMTVIGIGIAMLAIVLLGAMSEGLISQMNGMVGGSGAQLVGIEADASIDLSKIDEAQVRRISAMEGVQAAEGFLTGYTQIGDLPFFAVFGYQPRGLAIREFRIVEGEPLATNHQILLGRVAAENLGMRLGQTLQIFNSSFRLVGIYETGIPFQDGGGVITLRDAQRLFGQPRKVSFIGVWLDEVDRTAAVIDEVERRFPEIDLAKSSEFADGITDMQLFKASTWAISALALVVGGLGMTNTMVMSVFERTREIGVLRALGWRKPRVLGMIVRESVVLSLMGGIAGVLAGVALGSGLNLTRTVQGFLRLEYTPGLFAQAVGTALLLGVVGGVYPAWWASRLRPVEALRYE